MSVHSSAHKEAHETYAFETKSFTCPALPTKATSHRLEYVGPGHAIVTDIFLLAISMAIQLNQPCNKHNKKKSEIKFETIDARYTRLNSQYSYRADYLIQYSVFL